MWGGGGCRFISTFLFITSNGRLILGSLEENSSLNFCPCSSCLFAHAEQNARIKLRQTNQWIHTITPQTPMSYDFTPL